MSAAGSSPPHPVYERTPLGLHEHHHIDIQSQHALHVQQISVVASLLIVGPTAASDVQQSRYHGEVVQTCGTEHAWEVERQRKDIENIAGRREEEENEISLDLMNFRWKL